MNSYHVIAMAAIELCCKDKYKFRDVAFQNHVISVEYPGKDGEMEEVCQLAAFSCSICINIKIDGSTKLFAKLIDGPGNINSLVSYVKRCKDTLHEKSFFKTFGFSEGIVFNIQIAKGKADIDLNGQLVTLQELKKLKDTYTSVGNIEMTLMKDNHPITKDELTQVIDYTEEKLNSLTTDVKN
jgi:hypothetical protein